MKYREIIAEISTKPDGAWPASQRLIPTGELDRRRAPRDNGKRFVVHRTVQEQGAMIARQQKEIEALTAGLQKVSAQLETSKPAPQVVNNQ